MGIERVTTHPLKYAYMESVNELIDGYYPNGLPKKAEAREAGVLSITFELVTNASQRVIAQILAKSMGTKAVFGRDREWKSIYNKGYYEVEGWLISGNKVRTGRFDLDDLPNILCALSALSDNGYALDGITIHLIDKETDVRQVFNLCAMLEAKRELIEASLGLNDIMFIVDHSLALSLPLGAFDLPKIEAATLLLHQMGIQAKQTKTVRMKQTDISNPRYQMRTWLLRLGFIGEAYARPRKTLLENLEGNSAFFSEDRRRNNSDTNRRQI